MKHFFKKNWFGKVWPVFALFLIVALLFATNYKPGTILSGWDNLHPEFDFGLNIHRSIFAVWQEYQGLGLLGGMAHSSDLLRQIFLLMLSVFLPLDLLRYIWVFLTLLIGATGTYFLLQKVVLKSAKIFSFLGACFYLFNLSTAQMFYVPFEAFIGFFAFLPWLILACILYLERPSRKHLLFLITILLISTPAWYLQTVFIVFIIALSILCLSYLLTKPGAQSLKKISKLYGIIFLVNSFWLLPALYFTITNSQVNPNSKINQMATETIFLQNKEFGTLPDASLLKGFMFKGVDPNAQGTITYMLKPWSDHLNNPIFSLSGYLLFALVFVGFIKTIRSKNFILRGFSWTFIFGFLALAVDTPPFSYLNTLFRDYIPLLNQIFRFPFTKFSTLTSFDFAILFAIGTYTVIKKIEHRVKRQELRVSPTRLSYAFFASCFFLLFIFILPMFQGHLFYEKERVKIPEEYTQLFKYFKSQDPNTRIANFPQSTFWGWSFYNWPALLASESVAGRPKNTTEQSYGGSGFLWYGIRQPILDRAFDVWSHTDEDYYFEAANALYSKDPKQLERILNKYQISWILLDKNIFDASSQKALFIPELEDMLSNMPDAKKQATFGRLVVYKITLKDNPKNYVFLKINTPSVNIYNWNNYDQAYTDHGTYENNISKNTDISYSYPFRSLFSLKTQNDKEFNIQEEKATVSLTAHLPKSVSQTTLTFPSFIEKERLVPVQIATEKTNNDSPFLIAKVILPQVLVGKREITNGAGPVFKVQLPKIKKEQYPLKISVNGADFSPITNSNKDIGVAFFLINSQNILTVSDSSKQRISDIAITQDALKNLQNLPQSVTLDNKSIYDLTVRFPKIDANYLSFHPSLSELGNVHSCDNFRKKEATGKNNDNKSFTLESLDATACSAFFAKDLPHDQAYAIFVKSTHYSGLGLRFWIENINEQYAPLDTYLPKDNKETLSSFILPPMEQFGNSYAFHFDNASIGRDKTVNELDGFGAYPVFYNYLESIQIKSKNASQSSSVDTSGMKVSHPNESLYIAQMANGKWQMDDNTTFVLSQSFNQGWHAYTVASSQWPIVSSLYHAFPFIFGKEIKEHVMVNNWENGWVLNNSQLSTPNSQLVIVYLPQYLEYIGFLILFVLILRVASSLRVDKKHSV